MNGTRAIAIALLLCLVPLTTLPVGADVVSQERAMPVTDAEGTAEYLEIPPDELDAEGFERGELDVAGAVGADAGEIQSSYAAAALREELAAAETDAEREDAMRRTADVVDERIDRLGTRERNAIEAYGAGEQTGTELLRTLGIVDAESEALLDVVRELQAVHDETDDSPLTDSELATYRAQLDPLTGPVRERVRTAATGDEPIRVHLEIRGGAVVITMIDENDRYLREAHVPENVDLGGEDRLGFAGAEHRFEELYPWVTENNTGLNTWVVGGQPYLHHAGVYAVSAAHPHGVGSPEDLMTYIDGTTGDVFYETQRQTPEALPTRSLVSEDGDLRLHLNWTRAGGPMRVAVVDNATGETLDATVEINDERAGTTGGDRLWTVAPRGTVVVEATDGEREIETQITLR